MTSEFYSKRLANGDLLRLGRTETGGLVIRNLSRGRLVADLSPAEMASELRSIGPANLTPLGAAWLRQHDADAEPTKIVPAGMGFETLFPMNRGAVLEIQGTWRGLTASIQ